MHTINGDNAFIARINNRTNYAEIVVQEARARMELHVSPEKLGRGRQHVDCYGLEDASK